MTLIAVVVAHDQPVFLINDTAISGGGPVLNSDFFPVQESSAEGFFSAPPVRNDVLTGMSQKIWLSGRHAVLWAGRYFYAFSAIKYISENIDRLSPESFLEMIDEHLKERIDDVSFIYVYDVGDGSTVTRHVNCTSVKYGDIFVVCAGSGSYRFTTEFDIENQNISVRTTFQCAAVRAAHMYQKEILDSENYYHGIGIGYEFSILKREGWKKAPYCLAIFGHSDESFSLKKTISTYYRLSELYFETSTFKNQPNWHLDGWIYLPNEQIFNGGNVVHVPAFPFQPGVDPLRNWDRLDMADVWSEVVPLFTIGLIEGHAPPGAEADPVEISVICRMPATLGIVRTEKNKSLVSRAFFRREVEEFYLGRDFVPPPEKVDFYRKQEADQAAGIPLSFDPSGVAMN